MNLNVETIFLVLQGARRRVLFYCPVCEASNEIGIGGDYAALHCRECNLGCSATRTKFELILDLDNQQQAPLETVMSILDLTGPESLQASIRRVSPS